MKLNLFKWEKLWWSISAAVILAGIVAMIFSWQQLGSPLRPGLDFVGGTRLQLQLSCAQNQSCSQPLELGPVREILSSQNLGNSTVQVIEKYTLAIRSPALDVEKRDLILASLNEKVGQFEAQTIQIDTVGPTIGKELFRSGILAFLVSLGGIIIYLTFRFQLDYAFFAIVALIHDVLVTAGVFAILGLWAQVEVDSLFLVSLLTIVGFSVNDTVVIYDRIRETLAKSPTLSINEVVENSVEQTLTRSINTTLTTLLPLVAIFLFGGETLKYFALALIVGFIAGAYSSIFIASTLWAWWRGRQLSSSQSVG